MLITINKPQLKALSEIAHNVLKGIVTLTPLEKVKLKRYKKILTLLGRKIYETRETRRTTPRNNGARSFIKYRWTYTMAKMILIPYEKYKKLTTKESSTDMKEYGFQPTKKRKLGPPGVPTTTKKPTRIAL